MRKYLILIGLLTFAIGLPFVYQEWSEANRLKQIHQVRSEAQQIAGVSMADLLARVKHQSQERQVLIFFTGNTQGNLEPCGCFVGQSGGVARRSTVIETFRQKKIPFLLVDTGRIVEGDTPLDKLRTAVYLEAMGQMGYDAVCLNQQEVENLEGEIPFTLVSSNMKQTTQPFQPFVIRQIEGVKVTLIGVSEFSDSVMPIEATLKQHIQRENREGVTVLLSNLPIETNRTLAQRFPQVDVILGSAEGATERVGNALIAYAQPKGTLLSLLTLKLDKSNRVVASTAQEILLQEEVPDQPQVRARLSQFYQEVAANPKFQHSEKVLFAEMALEQDSSSQYVGSNACTTCHEAEYAQWQATSHAAAFNTLLHLQRHFYPDCVTCHTTGFGYPTGYQIGQMEPAGDTLKAVGCETCHGPGNAHTLNPTKDNIRGEVAIDVCTQCHTQEHAPGFLDVAHLLMKEVDHTETGIDLETLISRRLRGPMKPEVELFVMSYCPFGVEAEKELMPWLDKKFGGRVNFTLQFIASLEVSDDSDDSETLKFRSLHGQLEVVENIRQVVIAEYYPEKLTDYVLCRADRLKESWQICAQKVGLDIGKINHIVESDEGKRLFAENIKRSKALNISSSPTVVVDGVVVDRELVHKSTRKGVCTAF